MGEMQASVVVPAPVEGCKVGGTFPAGSGQFVGKRAYKVGQFGADPTEGTPGVPSVPAGSVGPLPGGAVTDAGAGYVALSSCLQGGRQPVHKGGGAVEGLEGTAFAAGEARGVPSAIPLCVPPVATEVVGTGMAIATMPPVIVFALLDLSGPWQLVVK